MSEGQKKKKRERRKGPLLTLRHLAETALVFCVTLPIALLPYGIATRAGRVVGLVLYHAFKRRRRIALDNVNGAIARGHLDASLRAEDVVREHFKLLGRWSVELVRVLYGKDEALIRQMPVEGKELFDAALARGKGILGVTAHLCNWELMGMSSSALLGPVNAIARRQSNPYMDWFINRVRAKYGGRVIYKEGALKDFLSILKGGGVAGVLFDQASSPHQGILVDFLGAPAWTMRTPVALARRTGAAVVPIFMRPVPGGYYKFVVLPEVEITEDEVADTRRLLSVLEEEIRLNPPMWLWIHRRWKNVPGAKTY